MKTKYVATLIINIIWIMLVSCGGEHGLEKTFSSDNYPAVSPDGRWVIFSFNVVNEKSENYPPSGLYIMTIDGKEEKLLFPYDFTITGTTPCWSPDGRQIVTTDGIYTIKDNMITEFRSKGDINMFFPSWSPDGKTILCFDGPKAFLCDTLFKNIRELPFRATYPRWMPDGKHIICSLSSTLWAGTEICITDTLGSNMIRLTHNVGINSDLAPSPDGTMIAWCSEYTIYIMNSDGTNQRELDNGLYPSWTPDSKSIVYTKGDNTKDWQSFYIWKTFIDGKEKIQITKNHKL